MKHISLLCLASCLLSLASAAPPPNILFIMTDDQGPWTPSFTGHRGAHTPNLDKLASQGMVFSKAFVNTPVCSPSRGVLMTSRYSSELGIADWIHDARTGLEPRFVAWPLLLKKAGYRTGLIGKWHLGHKQERHHPQAHGYDYFMGFLGGGGPARDMTLLVDGKKKMVPGLLVENLTTDAIAFIERNKDKPFCLNLHYRAPHGPRLPVSEEAWAAHKDGGHFVPKGHPDLNMKKTARLMQEHCASVTDIDRNLGRLMAKLDELDLADNTVVIFTSDHGYNIGHHGLQGKGNGGWMTNTHTDSGQWPHIAGRKRPNMFDTSLRVPFVVRWPKVVKAGTECHRVIDFTDLYPTFCALAGVGIPPEVKIHGDDFTPLLRGESADWNDAFYSEYDLTEAKTKTHMRCWRTPAWKLMVDFNNEGRWELYDLKNDPGETENLKGSRDPKALAARTELYARILAKMNEINDPVLAKVQAWETASGFNAASKEEEQ